MSKLDKIIQNGLCLGCGLCEAVVDKDNCEMVLNDNGFYNPVFKKSLAKADQEKILKCCPSIHVEGSGQNSVWGNILDIKEAWSSNLEIRKKGSSGGVISTAAIFLLENKVVDAILHVGVKNDSFLYNELKVSKTKHEVLQHSASRYAPALVFNKIKKILENNSDKYAFIGKPCDIAGIKNFISEYPEFNGRILYFFAIFCAGMPSYDSTLKILQQFGKNEEPISLKYRGDGWPGYFTAKFQDSSVFQVSYNDSWGKVLGKSLGMRCKICPDGIGLLADISVGDSWETIDGYPDFIEKDGRSIVLARTKLGSDLLNNLIKNNEIHTEDFEVQKIADIQRYQLERRLLVGYRILAFIVVKVMRFNFINLGLLKSMKKVSIKKGFKNFWGTSKRIIKIKTQ